jgi:hypothetical protein
VAGLIISAVAANIAIFYSIAKNIFNSGNILKYMSSRRGDFIYKTDDCLVLIYELCA